MEDQEERIDSKLLTLDCKIWVESEKILHMLLVTLELGKAPDIGVVENVEKVKREQVAVKVYSNSCG